MTEFDQLYRRDLGLPYDQEVLQRQVANGTAPAGTLEDEPAFYKDGSDLFIQEGVTAEYDAYSDQSIVQMVEAMDARLGLSTKKSLETAEPVEPAAAEIVMSHEEFDLRVARLHKEHPQLVDGIELVVAMRLDEMYGAAGTIDIFDPGFREDMHALVEAIYAAKQDEFEGLTHEDIEVIIISIIEKVDRLEEELEHAVIRNENGDMLPLRIESDETSAERPLVAA